MASDQARSTLGPIEIYRERAVETVKAIETEIADFEFTGKIFDLLNSTFSVLSTNIFQAFSQEFALLLLPLMMLYIVCVGFCGLQGWLNNPQKIIKTIGITYLVMSLMGSGNFLIDHVFWIFTELPLSIMGWVANVGHPQNIRGYTGGIDSLFTNIFSALKLLSMTIHFSIGNIWNSVLNALAILTLFGIFVWIFFRFIMVIIANIARVHILIALSGPIIYLSIFEKTRGLFFGMLRAMTNSSFALIFSGSMIALMAGAVSGASQGLTSIITQLPIKAVAEATPDQLKVAVAKSNLVSDVTLFFHPDFFMLMIMGVVLLSLISKSEELASMLTTAIATNSQGMVSSAAGGAMTAAGGAMRAASRVYSASGSIAPYAATAAKSLASGVTAGSNRIASGIKGVWFTK